MPETSSQTENTSPQGGILLREEILSFISTMKAAPVDMIQKYLPDYIPRRTLKRHLSDLSQSHLIYVDWRAEEPIAYLSTFNPSWKTKNEQEQQRNVIRAGWVVAHFGLEKVGYFYRSLFPVQIEFSFGGIGQYGGDITVINPENIGTLQSFLPHYWTGHLPAGVTDNICHIAVVPDGTTWAGYQGFMRRVKAIGFGMKATIDRETKQVRLSSISI